MINSIQPFNTQRSFKAQLSANDLKYKKQLISGIKEHYQFNPTIDDIESVLAPGQVKDILKRFTPKHYVTGENDSLFDNVKKGEYRVNLHVHTMHSDGTMTAAEYLEQSKKYSDKIANLHNDGLPAYTSAITDHNNITGVQEVIAMIADEPKKYKNFKFIPGCEFMFFDKISGLKFPSFEAVGLGINPFSKEILSKLNDFNPIDMIKTIKESGAVLSYAHPIRHCQKNGYTPEFIKYLKQIGIDGIESNYQYLSFRNRSIIQQEMIEVKKIAKDNNFFETGGTDTHGSNIFHEKAQCILNELI